MLVDRIIALVALFSTTVGVAAERPNIVLILADDLGYGDVGFNGCQDIPTPHIDSLVEDGVRFANGYSSHPFCSPMRAGLMAGRYQHRFGYVTNVAFDPHNRLMGIPESQPTVAKRLQQAGYKTGMVGKWHLGAASNFHPLRRGFDYFYGFLGGGHDYFRVDTTIPLGENYRAALDYNGKPVAFDGYLTDVLTNRAMRFVDQAGDDPYFLYVAYNAPHTPMQAPDAKLAQFASIQDKKRRIYAAMVSSMDDNIGRLLSKLEERNQAANTLVIFLSDNGGPTFANASNNGPLRGDKGDVWEGGIHVPFVMRMTGTIPAGTVYDPPVISFDATCTALTLAGVELSDDLEGVNLIPHVRGEIDRVPHETLFWRKERDAGIAVRRGDTKLVINKSVTQRDGNKRVEVPVDQTRLYDLKNDIGEQDDLGGQQQETVSALKAAWTEWNRENLPSFFPSFRSYHEQLREFHEQIRDAAIEADSK